MTNDIVEKAEHILEQLSKDAHLSKYLDLDLRIPEPYLGKGQIKLIVLGQDPTVKDPSARKSIDMVLNLDKKKSVWNYLQKISWGMGIDMNENVYATNLNKNFFVMPPTQIEEINIFSTFLPYWLPLLQEEIMRFPDAPVITLGEPVMQALLKPNVVDLVREYWGYTPEWKIGGFGPFNYIQPDDNILGRTLFPFPHQPSLRKKFYQTRMNDYIAFVKDTVFFA